MNYIKTINKQARQRGTTLIELSVVIAVILLLVGVLFIGISAWKAGANKAACVLNISSIQKAARGYQNMNPGANGAVLVPTWAVLAGPGLFFSTQPVCPTNGTSVYTLAGALADNTAFATCTSPAAAAHVPSNTANW
jgi:prepilin-type N-terminal cleavage/methylation domain-containing protein